MTTAVLEAWKSFTELVPVPLTPISSEQGYDQMVEFMNELMNSYAGDSYSPEGTLLHVVSTLVLEWDSFLVPPYLAGGIFLRA